MSGKRNPLQEGIMEGDFTDGKVDVKKPKMETESRTPSPAPSESPPVSPENPEMFDKHLKEWGLPLWRPADVSDDEFFLTKAESSDDENLFLTKAESSNDEKLYPTDVDIKIYTPERLTGYANQAILKYNYDKKAIYTFQGLHEVLSRCSDNCDRTFTIFFWAAAIDSDARLFKAFAVSGLMNGDVGLGPESDYYDATILEVDLLPVSPPQ